MADNPIKRRRQSETSKILDGFKQKNKDVLISSNERINAVLNNEFAQTKALAEARSLNQEQINKINNEYIRATQDVLSDDALQFLVQHSQIDAPTLTSIFAGFELAKASRARKLNEQRQFQTEGIQQLDVINTDLSQSQSQQNEQRIRNIDVERDQSLREGERVADALIRANVADISAEERAAERSIDRTESRQAREDNAQLQRELQEQRLNAQNRDDEKLQLFKRLQSGGGQTSGSVGNITTPNPLQSTPTPVGGLAQQPAQATSTGGVVQQIQLADPTSELSDDEMLLLNFDRRKLAESDPQSIFGGELVSGSTVANLSDEEQQFITLVRQRGGAEQVIQTLNDTQGFNIGVNENELTPAEREVINLNRVFNNNDDLGNTPLVNSFGDLTSEEINLVERFREDDLVPTELRESEFQDLVEYREGRDGEVIPIGRTFDELSEEDQAFITQRRLEQLDIPTLPPPDRPDTVTNSESADQSIQLSPEAIEQINQLNNVEGREQVDPLTIQQQLIEQGVDVSKLSADELNNRLQELGL